LRVQVQGLSGKHGQISLTWTKFRKFDLDHLRGMRAAPSCALLPAVPGAVTKGENMAWSSAQDRYNSWSIALHWGMLVLLVAVVALMELRGVFPKGSSPREAMKAAHYMFGLLVLGLAVVRIGALLAGPAPPIVPTPPAWQRRLASLVKLGLYAVMLGMPLVGWAALSAGGDPVPFFGLQLPALVPADKALAESLEEIHEAGASLAYVLVGLHVAAALFHHYVVGDNTLRRMWPRR
jgi:cytochrome b561